MHVIVKFKKCVEEYQWKEFISNIARKRIDWSEPVERQLYSCDVVIQLLQTWPKETFMEVYAVTTCS